MFPFLYMPYNFLLRFEHLKKNTSHSLCILALFRRRSSLISLAGGSRTSQTISDLFHPLASDYGTAALTVHLCFQQLPDSGTRLVNSKSGETETNHSGSSQASQNVGIMVQSFVSVPGEDPWYGGFPPSFPLLYCVGEEA